MLNSASDLNDSQIMRLAEERRAIIFPSNWTGPEAVVLMAGEI